LAELPSISIVIPAFNEGERLAPSLERVLSFVRQREWETEIIVVDDGSHDHTADIARRFAQSSSGMVRLLQNPGNRGKGYSVRNGMLHATGEIILFSDADLSSPIEEASKLIQAIEAGADIAIGSRWARSELQTQRQSLARQLLGRIFNGLLRVLLRLDFKDTQCGFKAFRRAAAQAIFPLQRIEGWGFDAEILFLAQKMGFKVTEVPVLWGHDARTRINPLVDGARMVSEMMRIRWYSLASRYYGERPLSTQPTVTAIDRRQN
jgi:glycosyltransferase involved in cell wall biosynthesis